MKKMLWRCGWSVALCMALGPAWGLDLLDATALRQALPAITRLVYPDADSVLLDQYQRATYAADGSAVVCIDTCSKVLTEKGRREQAMLSMSFDAHYSTAAFTRVDVLKPDGRVVPVDLAAQSRVMTDPGVVDMNIYDPAEKILQVSVPDLEVGDAIRAVQERHDFKSIIPNAWSDLTLFEDTAPICHEVYEVLGPTNKPLQAKVIKDAVPGTLTFATSQTNGLYCYRWEAHHVPRMFEEPNMPSAERVLQRVVVSTIPTWADISRWYWKSCQPHLEKATAGMTNLVQEVTQGLTNREDRLRAVFLFVSQQIRYMGLTTETESPGYEPHNVDITFNNRYGVCRDKAALLVALLRIAGFDAYPVLIHVGPLRDEEAPIIWFNHAITGIREADGTFRLMDSTSEHARDLLPAYLDHRSFLVAAPEGVTLGTSPITPATANLVSIETTGAFEADGRLMAHAEVRFTGINDNAYRGHFAQLKPEDRQRFFERLIKQVCPGAHLTEFALAPEKILDTSQPLAARLAFQADRALIQGDHLVLPVFPKLSGHLGLVNRVLSELGLEKRKYPMEFMSTCGVRETLRLDLHKLPGQALLPEAKPVGTDDFSWRRDMRVTDGVLTSHSEFLVKNVDFSPASYAALKQGLKQIEAAVRQPVILEGRDVKRTAPAAPGAMVNAPAPGAVAADSEILDETVSYDVQSATAWTLTRTVTQKILTYAGKTQAAEIKLSFNPAWETAELVDTSVTMQNGTVRKVSKEEINVMDDSWVGSAPRYPAAQTRVISLPGVEIGATIRYTTRCTFKEHPFFALTEYFQGFNPMHRKTVRLKAPRTLELQIKAAGPATIAEHRTRDGEFQMLEWQTENMPALRKEDSLPPAWALGPTVMVSAGDWRRYSRAVLPVLENAAVSGPSVAALARQLTAGLQAPPARLRALRDFVARQIKDAGPGLSELPLTAVSPAEVTLREGYGNSADRAVLLYTLLRTAGFKPEFILASNLPRVAALAATPLAAPQPWVFNTVLVRVDDAILLGDVDQYAEPGTTMHADQPGLDLCRGRTETLRAPRELQDRTAATWSLKPAADGTTLLTITNTFYGMDAAKFRKQVREQTPEERRRHFQGLVASISQNATAVSGYVTCVESYPVTEAFTVRAEHFAVPEHGLLYVQLPAGVFSLPGLGADARTLPLYWGQPTRSQLAVQVELPAAFPAVCIAPPDLRWKAPAAGGVVRCTSRTLQHDGIRELNLKADIDLEAACIPARKYTELLETNARLEHPERQTVVLGTESH